MDKREAVLAQFEAARVSFHALLDSLNEDDFQKRSLNPGWTNGEILAHITFGFLIVNVLLPLARVWGWLPKGSSRGFAWLLNAFTRPFNWINALGAGGQGRVFTRQRVGRIFDRVHLSLLDKVNSVREDEWDRGMYYPTKWDPNFSEFMTIEKLFSYPIIHLNFHKGQIAQRRDRQ